MKFLVRLAVAALPALLAACSSATEPGQRTPELIGLPRPLTQPEIDVRDASNRFAFTLFDRVSAATAGENVFVSPLSVSMSLGMALNGAGATTRLQMQQVLGFDDAELATIQNGYRDLSSLLRGLDPATAFQIANSIWYAQGFPFEPAFLEAGRTWFDAEVRAVDFGDSEGTKRLVNDWVSEKTNGRIPTIVDEVHPDDVMYLTNAIWFKGAWRTQFDPEHTFDGQFRRADGSTQPARMMTLETDSTTGFRAYADQDVHAGELPYGNGAYAMTILMPATGTDVDALAGSLTPARWNEIISGLTERHGWDVQLPKFTLEYERELLEDLSALGMPDAFDPSRADFTGMSKEGGLFIGFVKHKTFVQVDEVGTEAAAVTNTGMRVTSLQPGFRVDRPFVFAIRERLSGTILFIGKMHAIPAP